MKTKINGRWSFWAAVYSHRSNSRLVVNKHEYITSNRSKINEINQTKDIRKDLVNLELTWPRAFCRESLSYSSVKRRWKWES